MIIKPPILGKTDPPEFVAYEETMLREPRLLIPGMQPLGSVKIDWTNPLTIGLLDFSLVVKGSLQSLITRAPSVEMGGSYTLRYFSRAGYGIRTNSTDYTSYVQTPIRAVGQVGGSKGLTILTHGVFPTNQIGYSNRCLARYTIDADYDRYVTFSCEYDAKVYLETSNLSSPSAELVLGTPVYNEPFTCVGWWSGSDWYGKIVGQSEVNQGATGSFTAKLLQNSPVIYTGHKSVYIGVGDKVFFASALWNRTFTRDILNSLLENPYQFLIPA
jgi:hypothetical protein